MAGAAAACDVLADPNCGAEEPAPTTTVLDAAAVPSTTVTPVPTTEPPAPAIEQLAIGDSVMVGAIPALNDRKDHIAALVDVAADNMVGW